MPQYPPRSPQQGRNIPNVRSTNGDNGSSYMSRKTYEKRTGRKQRLWHDGAPCSLCGHPIYQSQLSQNKRERDIEETWCVHYTCQQKALNRLDRDSGMADFRQ